MVLALVHPHRDQVTQNSIIFIHILNLTYAQTAVVCIILGGVGIALHGRVLILM